VKSPFNAGGQFRVPRGEVNVSKKKKRRIPDSLYRRNEPYGEHTGRSWDILRKGDPANFVEESEGEKRRL